jgi:twitching motility protein PilT
MPSEIHRLCGLLDLLDFFLREEFFEGGVPRVSDLHLKSGQSARLRVDGELIPIAGATPLTDEVLATLLAPALGEKVMAGLRLQPPEDADASFDWAERSTSFRLNAFVEREGLACVFRVLPCEIPQPKDLGFPNGHVWRDIVGMQQGLVLVTGITGSGKSTTIASLLHHIVRNRTVRVFTLEDPIEYILPNDRALVSQRQVGLHVGSFAGGLRSGLREDPDIIFVGEMRDRETAGLALTAAETGHLVFSTLHTKDTKGALTRIVALFPPERFKELCSQLSFSLTWVIGQKLVNRADGRGRRLGRWRSSRIHRQWAT